MKKLWLLLFIVCSMSACEPQDTRPGFWLSGELQSDFPADWSFTNDHNEVFIEVDAMVYELEEFIADCRATLANGATPAALESVRINLEKLLANEAFVKAHFGPDATKPREGLHSDEELGFQIYAHLPPQASIRPPHDHANSWAIYGQVAGHTDMTDWELEDGADKPHPVRTYRLLPGDAGVFDVGALHSIDYCDGAHVQPPCPHYWGGRRGFQCRHLSPAPWSSHSCCRYRIR